MPSADSVVFRELVAGDIDYLAQHLCAGERETLRDVYGPDVDFKDRVASAVLLSQTCEAWSLNGGSPPLCVVGVAQVSLLEGTGNLWMLATEELFRHPRLLVAAGRRHVALLHRAYPALMGRIDARRTGTLKWLQMLGFTVGAPQQDGPVSYCYFARSESNV
jgi:hypothetical protein